MSTLDREADLERMLIREFLRSRGCDIDALARLSDAERTALLAEASTYAAAKLAEIEARAHFVHDIHGE
jgi:hypothetical protein